MVLLADGNYPCKTGVSPSAETIWLNLSPGLLAVDDVLEVLTGALPIEAAHVMSPDTATEPPVYERFRELLPGLTLQPLGRQDFYSFAKGPDLVVVVATGDQRLYANLMLTVGVVQPPA